MVVSGLYNVNIIFMQLARILHLKSSFRLLVRSILLKAFAGFSVTNLGADHFFLSLQYHGKRSVSTGMTGYVATFTARASQLIEGVSKVVWIDAFNTLHFSNGRCYDMEVNV